MGEHHKSCTCAGRTGTNSDVWFFSLFFRILAWDLSSQAVIIKNATTNMLSWNLHSKRCEFLNSSSRSRQDKGESLHFVGWFSLRIRNCEGIHGIHLRNHQLSAALPCTFFICSTMLIIAFFYCISFSSALPLMNIWNQLQNKVGLNATRLFIIAWLRPAYEACLHKLVDWLEATRGLLDFVLLATATPES